MITKQELGTVLRRIGERMSDKELKDMVDEVEVIAISAILFLIIVLIVINQNIVTFAINTSAGWCGQEWSHWIRWICHNDGQKVLINFDFKFCQLKQSRSSDQQKIQKVFNVFDKNQDGWVFRLFLRRNMQRVFRLFVHAMSLQIKLQSQWWKSMVKPNYYISNWFWNFINVRKFIGTNSPNYWEIFHWLKMSSILTDLLRLEIFLFDKLLTFHLSVCLTIFQD